ncbi:hypothetical protein DRE_01869 [Drechslerella stenobrocha 248]|uniref:Uncharacterized protein n=1 Tax=Drechslerella stenobrocha 248 TaxID=1043628 RepID=W7I992_9PEZI|nr:hypothetical protein DRE_01869 [Drechslerella stenobrocha 248]
MLSTTTTTTTTITITEEKSTTAQLQQQPQGGDPKQRAISPITTIFEDRGENAIRVPTDEWRRKTGTPTGSGSFRSGSTVSPRKKKMSFCRRLGSCIGRSCEYYSEYLAAGEGRHLGMP